MHDPLSYLRTRIPEKIWARVNAEQPLRIVPVGKEFFYSEDTGHLSKSVQAFINTNPDYNKIGSSMLAQYVGDENTIYAGTRAFKDEVPYFLVHEFGHAVENSIHTLPVAYSFDEMSKMFSGAVLMPRVRFVDPLTQILSQLIGLPLGTKFPSTRASMGSSEYFAEAFTVWAIGDEHSEGDEEYEGINKTLVDPRMFELFEGLKATGRVPEKFRPYVEMVGGRM